MHLIKYNKKDDDDDDDDDDNLMIKWGKFLFNKKFI
jgi:hypothetical protein